MQYRWTYEYCHLQQLRQFHANTFFDKKTGTAYLDIETEHSLGKYDKANDDRYLITDMSLSASPSSKQGVLTLECVKQSYAEKLEELTPLEEAPPAEQEESATFFNSRG